MRSVATCTAQEAGTGHEVGKAQETGESTGSRASVRPKAGSARASDAVPRSVAAVGSNAVTHPVARTAGREARRLRRPSGDFAQATQDGAVEDAQRRLERRIRAHLPRGGVDVTLTDNRYTMISVRRESQDGPFYRVRLHHMFAAASPAITRALAQYIARNDRRASNLLGDYIDSNQHRVKARTRRSQQPSIVTRGRYHDLAAIYDELNQEYFGGRIEARITWGQRTSKPRRRNSIKMGSYSVEDRFIRIHRSLDRAFVPRFFVEWIVYHEMLHQVHPILVVNGRRQFHTREFLEDEARFAHYAAAREWERAHLDELLTY